MLDISQAAQFRKLRNLIVLEWIKYTRSGCTELEADGPEEMKPFEI